MNRFNKMTPPSIFHSISGSQSATWIIISMKESGQVVKSGGWLQIMEGASTLPCGRLLTGNHNASSALLQVILTF